MSTICRSDIHSYEGRRPNPVPCILGHEIIGVIEEIGSDIGLDMRGERLRVSDRITGTEYFFDGASYYRDVLDLPQKPHGLRKYGHDRADEDPHFTGGFADYCYILPGTGILWLPTELSDEEATPLNCGVATPAASGPGARLRHDPPGSLPVPGHRRLAIRAERAGRGLSEGRRAQRAPSGHCPVTPSAAGPLVTTSPRLGCSRKGFYIDLLVAVSAWPV
jgi:hypothetical protein